MAVRLFIIYFFISIHALTRAQCFEIESILVDACAGNSEGENEMVIFNVGSTALNTANLSASWPTTSNLWLGICQDASTAASIAYLNTTITGCGFLKEPIGGILPANAKVLLITSTAFSSGAQSFTNLNDTLYVIFQCAGNTSGHFSNYQSGAGGNKTLSMSFSSPLNCSDVVTYDRAQLSKQNLQAGAQDGASVLFTPNGTASYLNNGCQAPYLPFNIDAGPNTSVCLSSPISLSAYTSNNYTSILWSLGSNATGMFSVTNSLSTIYTPGAGDQGTIKLYCEALKACNGQTVTVKDSMNINFITLPNPIISATSATLCSGQSTSLFYTLINAAQAGTTSVIWLPGNQTSSTIMVNATNIYSVNVTNLCGTATATLPITVHQTPTITGTSGTITCGTTVTLTVSSAPNYTWSNGANTSSIIVTPTTTTNYSVITSNGSCTASNNQTVYVASPVTPTISANTVTIGGLVSLTLTVLGANTYTWERWFCKSRYSNISWQVW